MTPATKQAIRNLRQAHRDDAEWTEPRRETFGDFLLAFVVWMLVIAAYILGGYAVWAMVL